MSLLDFMNSDEARLGIGLLAAGGYQPAPMNLGQRIASAFAGEDERKAGALKLKQLQMQMDMAAKAQQLQEMQAPFLLQKMQAETEAEKAKAARATAINNFYSPQNTAQFMKPAYEAVPAAADGMGPTRDAGPPTLDYNKMIDAGAAAGVVSPETILNHRTVMAQRQADAEQRKAQAQDSLMQRYYAEDQRSIDRRDAIEAANKRAQERLDFMEQQAKLSRSKDLKPGERFNMDGQIEVIPGSSEWNRRKNLHSKDYAALLAVDTHTDNAISKLDYILSDKNKAGFERNFGGWNAAVTRQFPDALDMKDRIASLKSDFNMAGLEIARAGGSIGAITEREWKILERAIANIDYTTSEVEARKVLQGARDMIERIRSNAKDVYDTEWASQPQFYKGAAASGTPKVGDIMKGYRFKGGDPANRSSWELAR